MISVRDLSVRVSDRTILEGVNFTLPNGAFMAVLGPNGGGKSTLVRCVLKLQDYLGIIDFASQEAVRIGYVPQIKTLDRTFPARADELVATALKKRWPWTMSSESSKVVENALELVGAGHLKHQQIRNLSGGELQRVYLARAVIGRPNLLILDEPSAGVDQAGASDLLEIVESYRKNAGATVVMITHDWEVAFHHATHVLVLKTKQISFGQAEEALTETAIRQAFGHVGHSHGMLSGSGHMGSESTSERPDHNGGAAHV